MKQSEAVFRSRERFIAFVDRDGPRVMVDGRRTACWIWTGYIKPNGYGQFNDSNRGQSLAHRIAWLLFCGAIPEGELVLHKCDNRRCVRPTHLFVGTHADNAADMVAKQRSARGERHGMHRHPERRSLGEANGSRKHPERLRRGMENPAAKLTEEKVQEFRVRAASGVAGKDLAVEFGIGTSHVSRILSGKRRVACGSR